MKAVRRSRRGQVFVLFALASVVFMGIAGLAVDIGFYYNARRSLQTGADAAAISAAVSLRNGGTLSTASTAAVNTAKLNGFTNGQKGVTVSAAQPTVAPYNTSNYVQVTITKAEPTFFLAVLGKTIVNVSASAVSGNENSVGCIYALDPSRPSSIKLTGNWTVSTPCGIFDESASATAFTATGNGTVSANAIGIVGSGPGYTTTGNVTLSPTPKTGIAPSGDPLAAIVAPSVSSPSLLGSTNGGSYTVSGNNQTVNIPPGIYASGISVIGNNAVVTFPAGNYGNKISIGGNTSSATFNPGQYQNTGGGVSIAISGNATTVFNTGNYTFYGQVSITGNNHVTLSPGLYLGGISITGDATVTFQAGTYILGGGGLTVTGNSTLSGTGVTFYNTTNATFAYAPINLTGNERANLSAPTSGALQGMLFFQDRSVAYSSTNGSTVTGNSSSTFDGAIYFPTTALIYTGNSSMTGYTYLVADTFTDTGNSTISVGANYSSLSNGSIIKSSTIYE